jgi:hypothetical protein
VNPSRLAGTAVPDPERLTATLVQLIAVLQVSGETRIKASIGSLSKHTLQLAAVHLGEQDIAYATSVGHHFNKTIARSIRRAVGREARARAKSQLRPRDIQHPSNDSV